MVLLWGMAWLGRTSCIPKDNDNLRMYIKKKEDDCVIEHRVDELNWPFLAHQTSAVSRRHEIAVSQTWMETDSGVHIATVRRISSKWRFMRGSFSINLRSAPLIGFLLY